VTPTPLYFDRLFVTGKSLTGKSLTGKMLPTIAGRKNGYAQT
jgi:hypothetical protein